MAYSDLLNYCAKSNTQSAINQSSQFKLVTYPEKLRRFTPSHSPVMLRSHADIPSVALK